MKKKALTAISYISTLIIFTSLAIILVLYAAGYKLDIENKDIYQTGMIIVRTNNNENKIFLDDVLRGSGDTIIRDLQPGEYDMKITNEGYQSFESKVNLSPGEARLYESIVLFKESPKVTEFDENDDLIFEKFAHTEGVGASGNELYARDSYVTRFESNIYGASWYPNEKYIGFTMNDRYKIIDVETKQIFDLFEKKSQDPAIFVNAGKSVIYKSENKIYQAIIR